MLSIYCKTLQTLVRVRWEIDWCDITLMRNKFGWKNWNKYSWLSETHFHKLNFYRMGIEMGGIFEEVYFWDSQNWGGWEVIFRWIRFFVNLHEYFLKISMKTRFKFHIYSFEITNLPPVNKKVSNFSISLNSFVNFSTKPSKQKRCN